MGLRDKVKEGGAKPEPEPEPVQEPQESAGQEEAGAAPPAEEKKADEKAPDLEPSLRLDEALTAAGVTHELFLYEDTTHYLDQVNVTPDTAELYRRLTAFMDRYVRQQ